MKIGKFYMFKIKGWKGVVYGVICKIASDWVLIKNIADDFVYDGFAVIQMKRIKDCIYDEKISFREQVLQAKGIMDIPYPDASLENLTAPLLWFLKQQEVVFFTPRDENEGFMGKIVKVTKKKIKLYYINSEGIWESDDWDFSLNDLVVIEWQSNYINSLLKYNQVTYMEIKTDLSNKNFHQKGNIRI